MQTITLEIESPTELQRLLQLVQELATAKILVGPKKRSKPGKKLSARKPEKQAKSPESAPIDQPEHDFMQYVGILNTGLTIDEIDEKLDQIREYEWNRERTI